MSLPDAAGLLEACSHFPKLDCSCDITSSVVNATSDTADLRTCLQVAAPVIILAFLVVAGSCAIMIPVMLYVFQLHDKGWTWQYAALFGSMLASTDAVAIIATMKSSTQAEAQYSY